MMRSPPPGVAPAAKAPDPTTRAHLLAERSETGYRITAEGGPVLRAAAEARSDRLLAGLDADAADPRPTAGRPILEERSVGSRYGLEIRAPTEADAPGLAELLRAVGLDVAPRILASRLVALQAAGGTALIALEWGPPSGLVAIDVYRTIETDAPVAQITTLVVGPDERRRGIGRLLLKAASQAARVAGCTTLRMPVAPDRDGLAAFCRATGFTQADTGFLRPLRKKAQEP